MKPEQLAVSKWKCRECDDVFQHDAILTAINPFDPESTVVGCPTCKSVDSFVRACDWKDCEREATSGTPLADGSYTSRCWDHRPSATGCKVRDAGMKTDGRADSASGGQ